MLKMLQGCRFEKNLLTWMSLIQPCSMGSISIPETFTHKAPALSFSRKCLQKFRAMGSVILLAVGHSGIYIHVLK